MEIITSSSNPKVKQFLSLQKKSKLRKETNSFALEGQRELFLASQGGYRINYLFICTDLFKSTEMYPLEDVIQNNLCYEIPKSLYEKLSYRGSTEGILAVMESRTNDLMGLEFSTENPIVLVAENIEKPGNIGALLRTADAIGADAFILANPKSDFYNPNVLRSSVGCVFTVPIYQGESKKVYNTLNEYNIIQYAAALRENTLNYTKIHGKSPTAIWVGSEDKGLSDDILQYFKHIIKIPMKGMIDSLNLSVSAAVILYEILRQRED